MRMQLWWMPPFVIIYKYIWLGFSWCMSTQRTLRQTDLHVVVCFRQYYSGCRSYRCKYGENQYSSKCACCKLYHTLRRWFQTQISICPHSTCTIGCEYIKCLWMVISSEKYIVLFLYQPIAHQRPNAMSVFFFLSLNIIVNFKEWNLTDSIAIFQTLYLTLL